MNWENTASIAIPAAPPTVWDVLLDGKGWHRWSPGVEWMFVEGELASGELITLKPKGAPQTAFTIEEVTPGELLVMRITFGPVATMRLRWALAAVGAATQLSVTVAIEGIAAGLLLKKGALKIANAMPANIERLADLCIARARA
jgi:uncharacterized protein YndB with AHSA1/START domain